ncbi:hypothetical protein BDN67DRAFT_982608 [Paxillus ammoniavirescens]|nr:hypothetical protein BDN67DRAFT_982608 [Paxillus ammoniavirescens]
MAEKQADDQCLAEAQATRRGMLLMLVPAEVDDGDGGDSDAVLATASITPKITGKRSSNMMLWEAISTAQMKYNLEQSMKNGSGDTLTHVDGGRNMQRTLFFANLTWPTISANLDNHDALVRKVTNWAVLVEASKTPSRKPSAASEGSSSTSSPSFPPPLIVSSTVSNTTQVTSTGPFTPLPTPDVPEDVLVGGFGDEDLDDCEKQAAAILASMSVKMPTGKSIVEILPRPDVGAGLTRKSLKRKGPEPDYVSSLEVEFTVSDLDAEGLGDEDYPMGQEEVRQVVWKQRTQVQGPHSTSQTSVTAAITKPHVKKIKVEPGSVTSTGPPATPTTILRSLSATASPPLLEDLDANFPIVVVAYQHLCEWRHGVGSTTLALMINFFTKFEADEIQEMSAMLLERLVFLYEGLNHDNPSKAFWSHLMIELLTATHLQSTKGFVHGKIDFTQNNVKGKGTVKTPLKLNKGSTKESNAAHAFSDQNWGGRARKLTISAGNRTTTQLEAILELAGVSLLPPLELSDDNLQVVELDEEYALLWHVPLVLSPSVKKV